jgi:hypothetical protein
VDSLGWIFACGEKEQEVIEEEIDTLLSAREKMGTTTPLLKSLAGCISVMPSSESWGKSVLVDLLADTEDSNVQGGFLSTPFSSTSIYS